MLARGSIKPGAPSAVRVPLDRKPLGPVRAPLQRPPGRVPSRSCQAQWRSDDTWAPKNRALAAAFYARSCGEVAMPRGRTDGRLAIMDRRFICIECGMKWFVDASRPLVPDLTVCGGCGGAVVPLATNAPPRGAWRPGYREARRGGDWTESSGSPVQVGTLSLPS